MGHVRLETKIDAPIDGVFDAARDIDLHLESITGFDRPRSFVDEQVEGPFASFRHEHRFSPNGGGTLMTDDWRHASPLGWLGRLVDAVVLDRYRRRQLRLRARTIKRAAEAAAAGEAQPAASAAAR